MRTLIKSKEILIIIATGIEALNYSFGVYDHISVLL
jgi:hypothetical protein